MRPGEEWEVAVGQFSMAGTSGGIIRMSGPKTMLTRQDLWDIQRIVSEALHYATMYEVKEELNADT